MPTSAPGSRPLQSHSTMSRARRARGFTLIELMIVVALVALASALVVMSVLCAPAGAVTADDAVESILLEALDQVVPGAGEVRTASQVFVRRRTARGSPRAVHRLRSCGRLRERRKFELHRARRAATDGSEESRRDQREPSTLRRA